ncbi:DUF6609 family protein [Lactococcus ileimucosae]|uniref:DUF6609 family protein n=1 Tax=Lactococcus ileimucosae TaxID=2941329 RepID=UPI003512A186
MEEPNLENKLANQTISGGFIFVIGMAMFTLLGSNYKKPILFGAIYIIAIIVQLILMKKIRRGSRSMNNKKWVNIAFIFLGITCWASIFIGLNVLDNLNISWILLLLFVGLHFLFFIPANENKHWKAQVIFVILLVFNALLGLFLYSNQLETIFIIDGLIKMGYGAYMVRVTYKGRTCHE